MIIHRIGNLLEENAEALVNTVNCVGVMGKGIALQFKQAFPDNFAKYQKACRENKVKPGQMFVVPTGSLFNPKYIINFPTKIHWRGKSKIEYIEKGLTALVQEVKRLGIKSIAVPPLGCGNGGLEWDEVRPLIEKAFAEVPDVKVYLYLPKGSPSPDKIKIGTKRPRLTKVRALLIALMDEYGVEGYKLTLLEIQKLAYFLQEVGGYMKLNFVKHKYGPYAENLNFVLQRLEGHYIRGYGDRSSHAEIYLLPNAAKEAYKYLENDKDALKTLRRVKEIIEGFETPYAMELLASVHWVVKEKPYIASDPSAVVQEVRNWNDHKKKFREDHIVKAWEHLRNLGLFEGENSDRNNHLLS